MLTSYSFRDSDRLHVGFDVTDETNKDHIFEAKSFSQKFNNPKRMDINVADSHNKRKEV